MPNLPRITLFHHDELGLLAVADAPSSHADALLTTAGLVRHPQLPIHLPPADDTRTIAVGRVQHAATLLEQSGFPVTVGKLTPTVTRLPEPLPDVIESLYLPPESKLSAVHNSLEAVARWAGAQDGRRGTELRAKLTECCDNLAKQLTPVLELVDDLRRLDTPIVVAADELPGFVQRQHNVAHISGPMTQQGAIKLVESLYSTPDSPVFLSYLAMNGIGEWSSNQVAAKPLRAAERLKGAAGSIMEVGSALPSFAGALRSVDATDRGRAFVPGPRQQPRTR